MRRLAPALALLAALAACKGGPTAVRHAPLTTAASPAAAASALASSVPASRLLPPAGAATKVRGVLRVDPAYFTATGRGQVIANNGGNVLAVGIVANNGGGIVANNGGGILANNAGNLISNDGGSLISDNGLGLLDQTHLVSDNGLGLISDNGLGLISNDGGSLVSDNGLGYGLLAADAGAGALPAAGMLVGVASLADGKLLPIGLDAQGQPAYAAYSDAAGGYTLYLDPALTGNVRLVAVAPGASDPRTQYGLVFKPGEATTPQAVDEAAALASAFLRIQITRYLERYLLLPAPELRTALAAEGFPAPLVEVAAGVMDQARARALEAGLDKLSGVRRRLALQQGADAICALMDLGQLMTANHHGYTGTPEPAMEALADVARQMAAKATALLARDPRYFEGRPYMVAINRARLAHQLPLATVARGMDVPTLGLGEFSAGTDTAQAAKLDQVLVDLGLPVHERKRLAAAADGIYGALTLKLVTDEAALARVLDQLPGAVKAATARQLAPAPSTAPAATPPPAPAVEPEGTVSTLAGGPRGFEDGPATTARFRLPQQLALAEGPDGPTLYVGDEFRVRQVRPDAAGAWQVTTLAGGADNGNVDGPGATARFGLITGLAADGKGHLYTCDWNNRVRAIDLVDPAHPVTSIAGTGSKGDQDGPGASASFDLPSGICLDADGNLLVLGNEPCHLHKIDLADPLHPVTSVIGGGEQNDDGPYGEAGLYGGWGLALARDGRLLVGEYLRIRQAKDGVIRLLAGSRFAGGRDGLWADARFVRILGFTVDAAGVLYGTEGHHQRVFKATPLGDVETLAGVFSSSDDPILDEDVPLPGGYVDGPAHQARFDQPQGIAVDAAGNLYVADANNYRIRLIKRSR